VVTAKEKMGSLWSRVFKSNEYKPLGEESSRSRRTKIGIGIAGIILAVIACVAAIVVFIGFDTGSYKHSHLLISSEKKADILVINSRVWTSDPGFQFLCFC
jgi:hypothetical protein